jgi:hypothetical protein
MTAPVRPDDGPQSLIDWIQYLHAAAATPNDSPDYAEAREAMGQALRHIHALNVAETQGEANQTYKPVGLGPAAGTALMRGLSLGTGEPLAGFFSALQGKGFAEGAQRYREGAENLDIQHPVFSPAVELGGSLLLPAGAVGRGVAQTVKAGVPLTLGQGAGLLARGAATGAVPAAVSGFSAGGEDPGDFPARFQQAKASAEIGALLGLLGTGAGMRLARGHVERAADLADKGVRREGNAERLAYFRSRMAKAVPEPTDLRSQLLAAGVHPENVEAQLARQARGPERLRPAPDPLEMPTFLRREAERPVPIPLSQRPRPGHPVYTEGPAPTRSAEVRGGERLLPEVNPTIGPVMAKLRTLPTAQLVAAFKNAPQELRDLMVIEFQRRRITIPDLGIRPGLLQ